MPEELNQWLQLIFRWLHVVAGVMWIGHLWFFNFVNAQLVKTYDADSKKKVVPELMPRALYFFRMGALYTWITGVLLLGLVYYMGGVQVAEENKAQLGMSMAVGLAVVLLAFFLYDALWKSPLGKNEMAGVAVSFILLMAVAFGFSRIMTGRAVYIHVGGVMGTIMMMNVWMRIWPSQRKIIGGIKGTSPAPDAAVPAMAGLRSKHNTYLSVPLMFIMISNHYPTVYGHEYGWAILGGFILAGFGLAKFLYMTSAGPSPAKF